VQTIAIVGRKLGTVWTRNALAATLAFGLLLAASPATSQDFTLAGTDLQKRVNGALAMMQYCLTPEVTTSSLSINAGNAGVNGLSLYQLGGGFTWNKSFPLGSTLGRDRLHFTMETAVARYLGISANPANSAVGDFAEGGSS